MTIQPPLVETTTAVEKKQLTRKQKLVIASVAVGVVAIAAGAIIGIPKLIHSQQVSEYHELMDERANVNESTAELRAQTDAAIGLYDLQHEEVTRVAEEFEVLGKTSEPIFTADQASGLTNAGIILTEALAEEPVADSDQAQALSDAFEVLRAADAEALAKAEVDESELPEPTAPNLDLSWW